MTEKTAILVTGGAGYIGSHVCKALYKNGYNPIAYDNLSNGFEELVKWGELVVGDISDKQALTSAIKKHSVKAVVHMAAFIAAGESVLLPAKYYHNNTFGGLNVVESMLECGIKNIVFSSTAAIYGNPQTDKVKESHSKLPINPYGNSKLAVEKILEDFAVSDDLSFAALRYFNAAGADPEAETGCLHKVPNNLVPILMDVQSGDREKIQIFGDDYATKDGTCIRDYIHVSDLADAHVLALKHLENGGKNLQLNLGTSSGNTVMDVINATSCATGKDVPYEFAQRREGDPAILIADASAAQETLGWIPKHTSVDSLISTAWAWQKKHKGL